MQLNSDRRLQFFIYLIFFCITLEQLHILYNSKRVFSSISAPPSSQPDYVAVYEKKLANIKFLLPPKNTIGYIQDSGISLTQGHIYLSQYAMAPHLLQEKPLPDTVLADFPASGTLQNPSNPLYAERKNWLVLKDFKNGFLLIKRK